MRRRIVGGTVLATCLLLWGGCSRSKRHDLSQVVPVRGTLAYKGSPVAGAFLTFQSKDLDEPAFCWSDADGRFAAMTNDTIGIFPGEYVVTVSLPDGGIPQVYAEASSSPLRLRVESGSAQDFEIQLED